MNTIDQTASKFLGKQLRDYECEYNPELLVPIERKFNREENNIDVCFDGYDIWHNYECSFLTDNGYPISVVGKISIPSNSKYFIESKSMKLYFFSFHMTRLGKTVDEAVENFIEIVTRDLSLKTESPVRFNVFNEFPTITPFANYQNIENLTNVDNIVISEFKESPEVLELSNIKEYSVYFTNVRSNCRVTHQPDFATMYIHVKGETPTYESLIQYLSSFRNEFHFHEEVTEQVFNNIKKRFNVEELSVCSLFTRRGGLDICPCRATSIDLIDSNFIDENVLTCGTVYQ